MAFEVAENMLHQALFETAHADIDPDDRTVMAIVKVFGDHARSYYRVACIKRMFRWAASEELVPVSVYQARLTIEGLKRGRSGAKETGRVPAVPDNYFETEGNVKRRIQL